MKRTKRTKVSVKDYLADPEKYIKLARTPGNIFDIVDENGVLKITLGTRLLTKSEMQKIKKDKNEQIL